MSNLPQVTPRKLEKFFIQQKFVVLRQVGSHIRLGHPDGRKITIAIHSKPIAPGTFQSILRQAHLAREEFLKLFKKR